MYTQKQFETLQKYDKQLYNALYLNYARVGDSDMVKDLNEISIQVSNIGIVGGCSHCLMNHLKRLAKPYFDQKKAMEKAAEIEKAKKDALKNNTKTNTVKNGTNKKNNTRKGSKGTGGNKG